MSDCGSDVERDAPQDISSPQVAEKWRTASDIANAALRLVVSRIVPGADVFELCVLGDAFIVAECAKVYQKKDKSKRKVEKGVAFPTSISVDEVCCNFSPVDRASSRVLGVGELCKVSLGAHIDGFVALAAFTVACCQTNSELYAPLPASASSIAEAEAAVASLPKEPPTEEQLKALNEKESKEKVCNVIDGKKGAVLGAAWVAAEAALRTIKPGAKGSDVTRVVESVARFMEASPLHGVLSHQLKRHVVEGAKCFPIVALNPEEKVEDITFAANEVYALDIIMSSGDGKAREADGRTTVYRRAVDRKYILKSQLGRAFMSQVENKFPTVPFCLRQLQDGRACKVGVAEATRHDLIVPYPVLTEKQPNVTAQFRFTIQVTEGGIKKLTGLPFHQERKLIAPPILDDGLKALLATSLNPKKNKKKTPAAKPEGEPTEAHE